MDIHSRSEGRGGGGAGSSTLTSDAYAGQSTYTEVIQEENSATSSTSPNAPNTLRLRLTKKPTKTDRRVSWTNDTVDNEFLNKKKSKCCCVYSRPRNFDESSSDDDNEDKECLHCKGHRKTDFNSQREKRNPLGSDGAVTEPGSELLSDEEDMSHDGVDKPRPSPRHRHSEGDVSHLHHQHHNERPHK
jgi:hypothetical protein